MSNIKFPFPLDDYILGYLEVPYGHVFTEREIKRIKAMVDTFLVEQPVVQPKSEGEK